MFSQVASWNDGTHTASCFWAKLEVGSSVQGQPMLYEKQMSCEAMLKKHASSCYGPIAEELFCLKDGHIQDGIWVLHRRRNAVWTTNSVL